ncbi:MAG TPA: hypothetical protein VGE39_12455 [Prosthecobacter sp.]
MALVPVEQGSARQPPTTPRQSKAADLGRTIFPHHIQQRRHRLPRAKDGLRRPAAVNGTQRTDEIVDILWLKQPTAQPSKRWFRFDHKKTAFQGDRESSITAPLEMR